MRADMTTKEKIEIMQAFEDGKEIEFRSAHTEEEWMSCYKAIWNWEKFEYRVKPDPKYVPYDSVTEVDKDKWVKLKANGVLKRISGIDTKNNSMCIFGWINLKGLFERYTYEDGTPCGKLVET